MNEHFAFLVFWKEFQVNVEVAHCASSGYALVPHDFQAAGRALSYNASFTKSYVLESRLSSGGSSFASDKASFVKFVMGYKQIDPYPENPK